MPESQINRIIKSLSWLSRIPFEQNAFELLNPIIPSLIDSKQLGKFDKIGIDAYTIENETYDKAYQFKGFEKREFAKSQVGQCVKSIESFIKGGISFNKYLFIVNRPVKPDERKIIEDKLKDVPTTVCPNCLFLDVNQFVSYLRKQYKTLSLNKIYSHNSLLIEQYRKAIEQNFYLTNVPYVDTYNVSRQNPIKWFLNKIYDSENENLISNKWIFIRSEFGFGKTSFSQELITVLDQKQITSIYLPLNLLSKESLRSTANFSKAITKIIYGGHLKHENKLVQRLIAFSIKKILLSETNTLLILDGLDENKHLYDSSNLKVLFNSFHDMVTPIIFTLRTEFWEERNHEFRGILKRNPKNLEYLEFVDWGDEEILAFSKQIEDEKKTKELNDFIELVRSGKYLEKYGDIPRRPLFLKMLLEDLGTGEDLNNISRLYESYFMKKLERDIYGSVTSVNRSLRTNGGLISNGKRIMNILEEIASLMQTPINTDEFILEDEITEQMVQDILKKNEISDILNLLLHSVLMPSGSKTLHGFKLKFAHKSYQEFFTARYFIKTYDLSEKEIRLLTKYPVIVRQFMLGFIQMKSDGNL